ncbi:hypothetical protein GOP47_0014518 [Adiantum capillus-veneris]|uniref:Uncharacterized protein n=1 Tax=Adiantum capillus-veneris TaxID=13818 RepID=A0A9D4ULU1_ADICA|nr:hypothetical protein GOP47_0014518 [Adiantum capillus-veneris]
MASLYYCKQATQGDEGIVPKAASTNTFLPLHSNTMRLISSSSSDLLAHHKTISPCNFKSRSFDVSCASTYSPDDHSASYTDASTTNPASCRDLISTSMDSNDSKMVPFKWEEAPGKPINTSSCHELVTYNPSSLQLPPRLQCQGNQSPLHLLQKSQACHHETPLVRKLTQPINQSLFRTPPNKHILKKLCKYMLKTASCTRHAPPVVSHPWSNYPPCIEFTSFDHNYKQPEELSFNDRLFFDRYSPRDLKYGASMDSILPIFDVSAREDEFVSRKALNFLATEEHEDAESNCTSTSPWKPISFHHDREGSASPCWQPSPTIFKVHDKLLDDDDDDEGFHDFFSTSSSRKASQRTDCDESVSSSPMPWYLDFSPEEEEVHVERREGSVMVRSVVLIKLKRVISKFKRRSQEGGSHQSLAENTMWSPTLATYLYNQQLEEEKQVISTPNSSAISTNYFGQDDGRSELGSNRLQIDPNYYLPSTIRTHFMKANHKDCYLMDDDCNPVQNNCYFMDPTQCNCSEDEKSTPLGANQESQACKKGSSFAEESHERRRVISRSHRLSLKEQLAEFDDEYLASTPFYVQRNCASPSLGGHPDTQFNKARGPSTCRGMCKVRKTVKVLASAIKLILVQAENGKRKGGQRSFKSCIKPTLSTRFSFHFSKK